MHATPGTRGYESGVERFIQASQTLNFAVTNRDFLPYLPPLPARVLDLGAGVGQNAAALARLGYEVVAVEPLGDFVEAARRTYPGLSIHSQQDSLPQLESLHDVAPFDFILLDGVWHHLDPDERPVAMARIASLMHPGGRCAISLRNGPAGMGTHLFPTSAAETIRQGAACGLKAILHLENQPSLFAHKVGVSWARVVLEK